jgi:hypothetical protein
MHKNNNNTRNENKPKNKHKTTNWEWGNERISHSFTPLEIVLTTTNGESEKTTSI